MTIEDLVYIDENGYFYADYPAFLEWLQGQYKSIYGEDTYVEPDSQDGQFIAILAKAIYDTAALGNTVYSSFSPTTAQGTGLSRNVKINGLRRRSPTKSTVDITIVGQAGTTITNGVVQDTLNQKWDVPSPTVIPGPGELVVTATAQEEGAFEAAPGTVTKIFTPTLGWQTVDNVSAAAPGEPVETDAELRVRQSISTANPSLTVLDGTVGAVGNLDGVTDVRGYENDTGSVDANGLPAHSFSIVVQGGDSEDIAESIALHKTPGTRTFGTTSETVVDARGVPITINFFRPTLVVIGVRVTIVTNPVLWTTDYEVLIKESVANYIETIGIGNEVLLSKVYIPAYLVGTVPGASYDIAAIELQKDGGSWASANITIDFDELATCVAATDVVIVVS